MVACCSKNCALKRGFLTWSMGGLHEREVTMAPAPLKLDAQCVRVRVRVYFPGKKAPQFHRVLQASVTSPLRG